MRCRHLVAVLLALLAACASGPARISEAWTDRAPPPRGAALLRAAMLDAHATARRTVGLAPLAWDEPLAADAQAYADVLAHTGRFAHAHQSDGSAHEGENLWTGTRGAYRYDEMIGAWAAERHVFSNVPVPAGSSTGRWGDVAHYSQMVWRGSSAVGCALASNQHDDFLVCRYAPPGNVVGERTY